MKTKTFQNILDRLLTAPGEALVRRDPAPAKPAPPKAPKTSSETLHTVYLLLDISGSMNKGKLSQAERGGIAFAEDAIAKGYRVGVIQFSTWARIRTEPTTKLGAIRSALSEIGLQATTNMASAIALATRELAEKRESRVMVLVTDGYPDSASSALAAAREAKQHAITIIAIGTEDADRDFLKKIATASELATIVPDSKLEVAITDAARLLPARTISK